MPSEAVFTSGHTLKKPQKGATLSHFVSRARRLSGRRSCSTSRSVVMTFDMEGPFSASQKASWRTCTGKRPAISAGVHYLPVSLSCATVIVGRIGNPSYICSLRSGEPFLRHNVSALAIHLQFPTTRISVFPRSPINPQLVQTTNRPAPVSCRRSAFPGLWSGSRQKRSAR